MGAGLRERITEVLGRFSGELLYGGVAVALVIVAGVAWKLLRRRRRGETGPPTSDLVIDVATLPELDPPPKPPILEFYNLPVRLVAIVLAPVGRVRELPSREELPDVIDSILPGLDRVTIAHKPVLRAWPPQVSARGFAHAFFKHVRLPGDHGKKTPWCSVAGRFMVDDTPMMAGLVLRAKSSNRHGQYVMEQEEQWLGVLRIRLDD